MDHAISELKQRMRNAIGDNKSLGLTDKEMVTEIKAYVKAINELEKFEYGQVITRIESILIL